MICDNLDVGFKVISACNDCKIYREGEIHKLSDLIPRGHCFELLHSLLPYMVTFEHEGWFKWERVRNRVVVCCPAVKNNVCVEFKKNPEPERPEFVYKVLKVRGSCKFYDFGKVLQIGKKDFSNLCWKLFNIIFPYLRTDHHKINITCGKKSRFELFRIEGL